MLKFSRIFKKPVNEIKSSIFNIKGTIQTLSISSHAVEEKKIRVKDVEINYAKAGNGEHPVLLLPAGLGSIWTDFKPQIEALDKEKFTIIAWDPPGYGKSRPPDREFPPDYYYKDADYAYNLMKNLGFSRFSLLGWCNGGITSLIMAANNSESIRKMVVLAASCYVLPQEAEYFESIKDIDKLTGAGKAPRIAIYGEDYFRKKWAALMETTIDISKKNNGDICSKLLKDIKCPTLITHGNKDHLIDVVQTDYLYKNISNSRLEIFEEGSHFYHLQYPEKFNQLVTQFLLENP